MTSPFEPRTRIGVVADTHGLFDPALNRLLARVELILHAGDVGGEEVLEELRGIAPVRAVRGNVDSVELSLPLSLRLEFGGVQAEMQHILPALQSDLERWAVAAPLGGKTLSRRQRLLAAFDQATRIVIFGHSHRPCLVSLDGVLFFNPGSAGKKRFNLPRTYGLLECSPGGVKAKILAMEKLGAALPAPLFLNRARSVERAGNGAR